MSRNYLLVLLGATALLGSCSSAYRSGQTPDDVYYSPAKERPAYVAVQRTNDNGYYNNSNQSYDNTDNYQRYDDYVSDYRSDRFMRLSMLSPLRLSIYDDFYWNDLRYNNYNYYSYSAWNNPWNGYYYWNSFYNPYSIGYSSPFGYGYGGYGGYYGGGYGGKTTTTYANARSTFNPGGYLNRNYSNNNRYISNDNARGRNTPNNGFQGSNIGRYFSGSNNTNQNNNNRVRTYNYNNSNNNNTYRSNNNNNNNNYTTPQRSYTPAPSSNNNSSSGSSSGSSGGGGRPHRGG